MTTDRTTGARPQAAPAPAGGPAVLSAHEPDPRCRRSGMSPTLSLRRGEKKTVPELGGDQVEDVEYLPPVANGRHQTTSALGVRAATVGLLT